MSNPSHGAHAEVHIHEHSDVGGIGYGSMNSYLTGLGLAAVLSALALGLVASGGIGGVQATALVLLGIAIARVYVHAIYFLRLRGSDEGGWTGITTIFTLIVVVIAMVGSIWIMLHQEINMMPLPGTDAFRGQ
ncbi:MAG: cytochrome C oxidase subunit IV family protein [Rhodospirillaceae bacterium]